ncbi:ribosome biogenesis protein BMS1 homolog [Papaver somniferum]|uniref:ribosome biogenesis protein BMS1 homolog n=1 Tax=Papaver somniferum TaxID=3469 RepID=UPI000E6F57DE|nr:ribosome biogenesis protein BMS1 homolog [Papaver somniferum]
MGVLTHLDQLKDYTKLNETEERLQDLFRTEIYQGAITYNISGLQDDLLVMMSALTLNLTKTLSELLIHSMVISAAHPFVLVDCFEDVTPPEKVLREANCGRNISLYGYLRGCDIKSGAKVHIAGLDDFHLAGVRSTIDPFPLSEENNFVMLTPMENETFRTGTYLRLEVHDVPFRMVANFYSCHPILVGGISPEDKDVGYMQAMLKRHNWHMKLLMSAEPVTMSAGWRRYGTKPIYARQIDNARHQIRDFIPEREHCLAMFWGPLAPAHTRITVVHKTKEVFRIAAKAVVLDPKHHFKIMKDSKRKGKPEKILKDRRSALIKFEPEDFEDVAAFKGASIRTDSGIWGKVIKAKKKKGGC